MFASRLESREKHGNKWKRRYDAYGVDGLKNQSRKPHNIKNVKVTEELVKLVLELRLNNRFGPMRIRFRLKRKVRSYVR